MIHSICLGFCDIVVDGANGFAMVGACFSQGIDEALVPGRTGSVSTGSIIDPGAIVRIDSALSSSDGYQPELSRRILLPPSDRQNFS